MGINTTLYVLKKENKMKLQITLEKSKANTSYQRNFQAAMEAAQTGDMSVLMENIYNRNNPETDMEKAVAFIQDIKDECTKHGFDIKDFRVV